MWWDRWRCHTKTTDDVLSHMPTEFQEHWTGSAGLSEYKWGQTHTANRVPKESSNVVSVHSISFTNNTMACEIWGTHSNVADDPRLLGCGTVSLGECFPTFWRIIAPSSSGSVQELLDLLDPEDEGTTILKNSGNYSPNDEVLHRTRRKSTSGMEARGF